jgi:subtilisin family serine protease
MKLRIFWPAVSACLIATVGAHTLEAPARTRVQSKSDLPRFSYPLDGSASALVDADDATFEVFAARVRSDLDQVLARYQIEDKSTLRELLQEKQALQELAGDFHGALESVNAVRALEEKPSARLTSGLFARARLQAAIDSGAESGAAYERAFANHYREAIEPLPWEVVQDDIKASYAGARVTTRAALIGQVKTDIDPAAAKSGAVDNIESADLVETRNALKFIVPVGSLRGDLLHAYMQAHNITKPDIWAEREVTLTAAEHLTPVRIGIWDSGVDVALYPTQLSTDSRPTASGSHGLAFDDEGSASTSWLHGLTSAQQQAYPQLRELITGLMDLQNGVDSPEADATLKLFATFSVDQIHEMMENNKVLGHYLHGTHVAGIAVRGNPAARLVVARFNDNLPDLPFAPSEQWVRRLGADFQQMADYFRTRHVRVVNMSWGDQPEEFETWLSKTGGGADPAARKQRAAKLFALWRQSIEAAIKSAPATLFVAAAGNSNSNVKFIEDVPASLHLPNLLVVAAVNQAGDETSFTSHGETVLVDANGYHVDSFVPGGARLKLSGTSMASPNVTNLAGKLFALDPALTPTQVIALITDGATCSDDGRRNLIDEKRSVELLHRRHAVSARR